MTQTKFTPEVMQALEAEAEAGAGIFYLASSVNSTPVHVLTKLRHRRKQDPAYITRETMSRLRIQHARRLRETGPKRPFDKRLARKRKNSYEKSVEDALIDILQIVLAKAPLGRIPVRKVREQILKAYGFVVGDHTIMDSLEDYGALGDHLANGWVERQNGTLCLTDRHDKQDRAYADFLCDRKRETWGGTGYTVDREVLNTLLDSL